MAEKKEEVKSSNWVVIFIVVLIFGLFALLIAGVFSFVLILGGGSTETRVGEGNVALIAINQPIYSEEVSSGFMTVGQSSQSIVDMIKEADGDSSIDAIVFEINSPGGSAVASEEIARAVGEVNKPTVAWVREVGASGAYWVASAADEIIASRMSIVGSIGVIASYLQVAGLMERYNVTYERMVAGKYKDMGTPYKELTDDEREMFQKELNVIHDIFIEDVAINRKMNKDDVKKLAEGQIFLGDEALRKGLIDQIGSREEVISHLEDELGMTVELVEFRREKSLLEVLSGVYKEGFFEIGRGIGSMLLSGQEQPIIRT